MSDLREDSLNTLEDNPDVAAARTFSQSAYDATLDGDAPVLVYTALDNEEADVIRATLGTAGIPTLLPSASVTTVMGAVDSITSDTNNLGIYVAPSQVEAARALLNAPVLSDEELSAEVDADTTTLAEAEARVKNV